MKKNIDLGGGKKAAPPPSRKAPPGVTAPNQPTQKGQPLMPVGVPVAGRKSYTAQELSALQAVGMDPTRDAIPPDMAKILHAVSEDNRKKSDESIIPVDPSVPRPKFAPVALESLPESEKVRIRELAAQSVAAYKAAQQQQTNQAAGLMREGAVPGLNQAMRAADQAAQAAPTFEIGDDEGTPAEAEAPGAVQEQPAAEPAASPPGNETGAAGGLKECPHCMWPLDQPDIPEPDHATKMAFLQSILGGVPFTKTYELFGGAVQVQFRGLTTQELDTIFAQADQDVRKGRIEDFTQIEQINRYRLVLQLSSFKTNAGVFHDLPDGLSKEKNPHSTACWWPPESNPDHALEPGETPLGGVMKYICENVLVTEQVFRVVNGACHMFNRLSAKLEAMADNSDFWSPTGAQS